MGYSYLTCLLREMAESGEQKLASGEQKLASGEQKLASVEPEFWIRRWDEGQIGWHKDFVDVMLKVNFEI